MVVRAKERWLNIEVQESAKQVIRIPMRSSPARKLPEDLTPLWPSRLRSKVNPERDFAVGRNLRDEVVEPEMTGLDQSTQTEGRRPPILAILDVLQYPG
jgi:hypothetical protein